MQVVRGRCDTTRSHLYCARTLKPLTSTRTDAYQSLDNPTSTPASERDAPARAVLAPNGKIYAIPYAAAVVLEIDTEARTALPFAATGSGWAKWAGGVLATNGKIYGIPALATGILEIGECARLCWTLRRCTLISCVDGRTRSVFPFFSHAPIRGHRFASLAPYILG